MFGKDPTKREGMTSYCRPCKTEYDAAYCAKNAAKKRKQSDAWIVANREKARATARKAQAKYREKNKATFMHKAAETRRANPEKEKARNAKWLRNNPHKNAAKTRRRYATRMQATPSWANQFFISEAYHLSSVRSKLLGVRWSVDHIVPLKSKLVCGLHVENNLSVIPASLNSSKGNRWWPDMP